MGGGIADRHILWKPGRIWLPIQSFTGFDNNGVSSISLSQGTPTLEPTSGPSELTAMPATTADEVHTVIPVPWDYDRDKRAAARVYFIHASTDASDAPVFKLGTKFLEKQATVPEIQAGADVTTTITHGGTSATDDSLEVTPWFDLSWDDYVNESDILIALALELDALGSAGADECEIIGVEIAYDIKACYLERKRVSNLIDDNTI